ncbi:MAG: S-methyl-5-thioribose-1-phosphate isomerase [Pseudomonadales bacterium]
MLVDGKHYRTIWLDDDGRTVTIIDQTKLPYEFELLKLRSVEDTCAAISNMQVRGAPLIGATAASGIALALNESNSDETLLAAKRSLANARPTAVNLAWAVERMFADVMPLPAAKRVQAAYDLATVVCEEDVKVCEAIGDNGLALIKDIAAPKRSGSVNILTHCNAGWLATVDWGTALAPIYKAHEAGIDVHVWVDETRPRNQGAFLTAWELSSQQIKHTVITDNAGGHLMQRGLVDLCLVGTDRTSATGDVCNKIGTYLKALAARHNNVPFYACVPSTSIDWNISDGVADIPIEQRSGDEVRKMKGLANGSELIEIELFPEKHPVRNDGFDTTPSELVSGLITERGVADASEAGLRALFPELSLARS